MSTSSHVSTQIINFQISPYSDEIASYINALSEDQIYHLFSDEQALQRADLLTAGLLAIYKLESEAKAEIQRTWTTIDTSTNRIWVISGTPQSWILREAIKQCPNSKVSINVKTLGSLGDIYLRDRFLFDANINELSQYPHVFVLVVNGIYSGHVYAWTIEVENSRVTNVIGIRSSILQLLGAVCDVRQRGVAPMFFSSIHRWAAEGGSLILGVNSWRVSQLRESSATLEIDNPIDHYIRVLQPIGPMPDILKNCGFVMVKPFRNNERVKWLLDNATIGSIPLTTGLIFRDYDYIIKISDALLCSHPQYLYKQI